MSATKYTCKCPECENTFEIELVNPEVGDTIECPICGSVLEIVDIQDNVLVVRAIVVDK